MRKTADGSITQPGEQGGHLAVSLTVGWPAKSWTSGRTWVVTWPLRGSRCLSIHLPLSTVLQKALGSIDGTIGYWVRCRPSAPEFAVQVARDVYRGSVDALCGWPERS